MSRAYPQSGTHVLYSLNFREARLLFHALLSEAGTASGLELTRCKSKGGEARAALQEAIAHSTNC